MKGYVSRLAGLAACFLLSGPAWAQAPQNDSAGFGPGPFRVVSSPSRRLSISITQGLKPMRGVVLFPQPPETPAQHVVSVRLTVGGPNQQSREVMEADLSPLKKPVHAVHLRHQTGGPAVTQIELELSAAKLEHGEPAQPVRPLDPAERSALLAAEEYYEYNTPFFRGWMKEHKLLRAKDEKAADFAFRALRFLRRNFVYKIPDENYMKAKIAQRKTGEMGFFIAEKAAECWGLSRIYTCTLRANGIPCRQVSGFILPTKPKEPPGHHVRAEVHLPKTGWILVECAGAVTAKNAPLTDFFCARGDDMVLIDRGIGYQLPGPKTPGRIGTFTGFAIGKLDGEWTFPFGKWTIQDRAGR